MIEAAVIASKEMNGVIDVISVSLNVGEDFLGLSEGLDRGGDLSTSDTLASLDIARLARLVAVVGVGDLVIDLCNLGKSSIMLANISGLSAPHGGDDAS